MTLASAPLPLVRTSHSLASDWLEAVPEMGGNDQNQDDIDMKLFTDRSHPPVGRTLVGGREGSVT